MALSFLFRAAEFTCVCKDSLKEFAPVGHDELRKAINKNGFWFSLERDTPKTGHKWFLVLAPLDNHLQAFLRSICRFNGRFVSLCHLGDGRSMFACQCLQKRCFCYPIQLAKPSHIVREEIVLNNPSVFTLIFPDNAVVTITNQGCSLRWLASSHVHCTFLFNDCPGHS